MTEKLMSALEPTLLEVVNESHKHAAGPGAESHFRVLCVSPKFDGLKLLERHRLVNSTVGMDDGHIHALSIKASR